MTAVHRANRGGASNGRSERSLSGLVRHGLEVTFGLVERKENRVAFLKFVGDDPGATRDIRGKWIYKWRQDERPYGRTLD